MREAVIAGILIAAMGAHIFGLIYYYVRLIK